MMETATTMTSSGPVEEQHYDDLDRTQDGLGDFDADQDGFESADWGGGDCDDFNENVYPAPLMIRPMASTAIAMVKRIRDRLQRS